MLGLGTAGNSLATHNGHKFSTKDQDNDVASSLNYDADIFALEIDGDRLTYHTAVDYLQKIRITTCPLFKFGLGTAGNFLADHNS